MTIDRSTCHAPRHGTDSAYRNYRCRCADAREARRLRSKRRREGRLPPAEVAATGSARRVKALAAIGWSRTAIADACHISVATVARLQEGRHEDLVTRSIAGRIIDGYDRLSGTPGPTARSRQAAARHGWVPPLLWEGVDIDNPAAEPVTDEPVRWASRARIDLADVDHLERFGMSLEQIAKRLGGVDVESIKRARQRAARSAADAHSDVDADRRRPAA